MKPKHYIKTFNVSGQFDRKSFIEQFEKDIDDVILHSGKMNVTKWKNIVNDLKTKFDRIFAGEKSQEKLWGYIYATIIIPRREKIFGKNFKDAILSHRLRTDSDFYRRYNSWKMHVEEEKIMQDYMNSIFEERFERIRKFFLNIHYSELEARNILNIPRSEIINLDIIKFAYYQAAKTKHPDAGGNDEEFIKIQKAKEALEGIYKGANNEIY